MKIESYTEQKTTEAIPSLNEFYKNHTEHNLKKVCLEIRELCLSIYSTLQTQAEKEIYYNALDKIIK